MDKLQNTKNVINSSNELYGACRHKCKFHRYRLCDSSSTDEGLTGPEKSGDFSIDESLVGVSGEIQDPPNVVHKKCMEHTVQCVPITDSLSRKINGKIVVDL